MTDAAVSPYPPQLSYLRLFLLFFRFGLLAFGGPVAQIAMIRRELVDEQRWLSSAHFNKLLAVMQVLPGPEAHELCVHLGIRAKGRLGGLLAGLAFMLPGFVLMFGLSWAYVAFGLSDPALQAAFLGAQIAVVALIVRAAHRIGEHVLENWVLWALAIGAGLAALAGAPFWLTLPACGLVYVLYAVRQRALALVTALIAVAGTAYLVFNGWAASGTEALSVATGASASETGALELFLSGLRAGLLTFGGAYTAIPFLRNDAVGRGMMTDGQFLDGLALSGVLPAPLIIFSTFVGYVAGGPVGAVAMTAGIFLPAFAFSMIFYDRLERVVEAKALHALLEGVAAGVVGLIAATLLQLAQSTAGRVPETIPGLAIFSVALAILYAWKSKLNVVVVIVVAAAAGYVSFGTPS